MAEPVVPFELAHALSKECLSPADIHHTSSGQKQKAAGGFTTDGIEFVPGHFEVPLNEVDVLMFLHKELSTPRLDALCEYLWLISRPQGSNIDTLHRQIVKGRDIVVSEDPGLHLVWLPTRIYVKPVPRCLLNFNFWTRYLQPRAVAEPSLQDTTVAFDRRVALGFMRSYVYLIQHETDFNLAKDKGLLPDVEWLAWSTFIHGFRFLQDSQVSHRYHFGQIRLSRLNWASRIFGPLRSRAHDDRRSWIFYEIPYWSTGRYVEDAAVILLFLFASLSLLLSAMQVMLAAPEAATGSITGVKAYGVAFWGFSIAVVVSASLALSLLVVIPLLVLINQLIWSVTHRPVAEHGAARRV